MLGNPTTTLQVYKTKEPVISNIWKDMSKEANKYSAVAYSTLALSDVAKEESDLHILDVAQEKSDLQIFEVEKLPSALDIIIQPIKATFEILSLMSGPLQGVVDGTFILVNYTKEKKLLLSLFAISSAMVLSYFLLPDTHDLPAVLFLSSPLLMASISFYKKLKDKIAYGFGISRFIS